jgi:archaemetzincin
MDQASAGTHVKRIHILPLGDVDRGLLEGLAQALPREMKHECELLPFGLEISSTFNSSRGQFHSTEILARMAASVNGDTWRLLGVTDADLYVPILTFVFGEAQLPGTMALVSTHRLRQEFYGLSSDEHLVEERLLKEAVHELGHTFGLVHCDDIACVMAASHAVEWIDLKGSHYCSACTIAIAAARDRLSRHA